MDNTTEKRHNVRSHSLTPSITHPLFNSFTFYYRLIIIVTYSIFLQFHGHCCNFIPCATARFIHSVQQLLPPQHFVTCVQWHFHISSWTWKQMSEWRISGIEFTSFTSKWNHLYINYFMRHIKTENSYARHKPVFYMVTCDFSYSLLHYVKPRASAFRQGISNCQAQNDIQHLIRLTVTFNLEFRYRYRGPQPVGYQVQTPRSSRIRARHRFTFLYIRKTYGNSL
jgi:hypothetical protein